MQKDKRSGKLILVAHCILNQNSKVLGLARRPSMIKELVELLKENDFGIIQMPCPELTFAGLLRTSQTKEQYDTPMFRRHCQKIARELADQIQQYVKNGIKVSAIIGVEGSPSCGIELSQKEHGILIEELIFELKKRSITLPLCSLNEKQVEESLEKIALALS